MLEGLGSINWSSLRHAFGPAHDVPQLLRELANDDASIRHEAVAELCSNIYHQGSVYEATSVAVPFLCELARADLPDPGPVLMVLLAVAEGADGQRRTTAVGRRIADGKFDPVRAKQHGAWAERVLQALRDECYALLGHDSGDWRYLATVVMVVSVACPDECARLLREVRERAIREEHAQRRLVWGAACFALGDRDDHLWDLARDILFQEYGPDSAQDIEAMRAGRWDAPAPHSILEYAIGHAWER